MDKSNEESAVSRWLKSPPKQVKSDAKPSKKQKHEIVNTEYTHRKQSAVSAWLDKEGKPTAKNAKTLKSREDLLDELKNPTEQREQEPDVQQLLRRIEQLEGGRSRSSPNVTIQRATGQKSAAVAYLLWLLFGQLGFHRFYFDSPWGILQAAMTIVGWIVFWAFSILIGAIILGLLAIWLLIDLFWVSWAIDNHK